MNPIREDSLMQRNTNGHVCRYVEEEMSAQAGLTYHFNGEAIVRVTRGLLAMSLQTVASLVETLNYEFRHA